MTRSVPQKSLTIEERLVRCAEQVQANSGHVAALRSRGKHQVAVKVHDSVVTKREMVLWKTNSMVETAGRSADILLGQDGQLIRMPLKEHHMGDPVTERTQYVLLSKTDTHLYGLEVLAYFAEQLQAAGITPEW